MPIYNVINSPDIRNDMNQFNTRLDHALSTKDNLFGSFSFEDRPHDNPGLMPTQGYFYPLRNELLSITQTYTFSPTVVNELRFGYNRGKTYLAFSRRRSHQLRRDGLRSEKHLSEPL